MKLQLAVTSRQAIEGATAAIFKSDDVMEDVGHLYKVEKTAASAIWKSDAVTEDVGHVERVEKTAATNGDAARRAVTGSARHCLLTRDPESWQT